uniref:Uncharacterized protein MANES_09G111300 n=1 Tax=Rhizophora mucronata TaxID=61149 RepID=A0A2P2Q4C0_RHIMU
MGDLPLQKLAISGPTLAAMMQRISSSPGDADGLLFGHVTYITPTLSDDSPQTLSDASSPQLVATVTSFLCFGSPLSFYNSIGRVDWPFLRRFLSSPTHHRDHLLGWFSGRRKTPIRPSMREFSVTHSLSTKSEFSFPVENSDPSMTLAPCVFLLFTTPVQEQLIHTREYRVYQFRTPNDSFYPKPIDVVNIGPAFRGHYGSFSPNSPFPPLNCEVRSLTAMNDNRNEQRLSEMKQSSRDQSKLDLCAEGFGVANLRKLVGSDASNYTATLEDLYEKTLAKINNLARQVEKSNAMIDEQESHNRKLRYKAARTALE